MLRSQPSAHQSTNQHRSIVLIIIAVLASLTLVLLSLNQHITQPINQSPNQSISHASVNLNSDSVNKFVSQLDDQSDVQSVPVSSTAQFSNQSHLVDLSSPLTRQSLGAATWSLLHTMAGMFPENPTKDQSSKMNDFIFTLGEFYPCKICAGHFRAMLRESPPDVSGRAELSIWLCERHNEVNVRLGKPVVECSTVQEVWPDHLKDCGCDVEQEKTD